MRIVIALGGNAILQPGQMGTAGEQMDNIEGAADQIARIVEAGNDVVLTHGNGPQVGAILLQNLATRAVPAMPLDVCGAESQGFVGYMFQQKLHAALAELGVERNVATVITQTLVSRNDPAFENPTKPIGPFYTEEEAKAKQTSEGGHWIEDAGRGWRRVVPSPDPIRIVERHVIRHLVDAGDVVICVGGGGIPVVEDNGGYIGVEAVIDKDLGGERLAVDVGADVFMILTDSPNAFLNYRQPSQVALTRVDVDEMKRYQKEGHFAAGSMGPKVKAAVRFIEHGGKKAIIASLTRALEALEGRSGTTLVPAGEGAANTAAGR